MPELADASESWPKASTDYVEAPREKCTHAFTYVNKDGSSTPELVLDKDTGLFALTTSPDKIRDYDVIVTITTSGAPKDEVLTVEDIKITTKCGPASTTITAADIAPVTKTSKQTSVTMAQSASFSLSNTACPIKDIVVTDAAAAFDSTVAIPKVDVSLKEANLGVVGDYSYSVTATADGGATKKLDGKMSVTTQVCTATVDDKFTKAYEYSLPETGTGS